MNKPLLNHYQSFSGSGLNIVFELKEEFNIAKNFLMGTLPYLGKNYKIMFDWFITGFGDGHQNISHFTIGGDNGVYGYRTSGVWLYNNNQIGVGSVIGIDPNKGINFPFALKTGTWMTMEISQYIIADNEV